MHLSYFRRQFPEEIGNIRFYLRQPEIGRSDDRRNFESIKSQPIWHWGLLEIAESSNIVSKNEEDKYELTKIGYFLTYNTTANANINFTNEVCYKGLFHMNDSIRNGKPEGLKELGDWKTIYEGLSQLTPEVQKAWFDFDHHYSDDIFEEALKISD